MADPAKIQAWAWAQTISPEEKIVLLALTAGEAEPRLDDVQARTGLGVHATKSAAERLHKRGLIDDALKPVGP